MLLSWLSAGDQPGGAQLEAVSATSQLGTSSSAQAHMLLKAHFQPGVRHSHHIPVWGGGDG